MVTVEKYIGSSEKMIEVDVALAVGSLVSIRGNYIWSTINN
jgi:hypothetical protein